MKIESETSPVVNSKSLESRIWHLGTWTYWRQDPNLERNTGRRWLVLHIVKMCILLVLWACFTLVIMACDNQKEPTRTVVTVMPNETVLRKVTLPHDCLRITLRGPINSYVMNNPHQVEDIGFFGAGVRVEYRNSDLNETYRRTAMWNIVLDDKAKFNDVTKGFRITPPGGSGLQAVVSVESMSDNPVGLLMELQAGPLISDMAVLYAGLLIILLYLVVIFDVIDRTLVALLVGATAIAALAAQGHRPDVATIVSFVNFETLMLLFGIMIIVDLMATTGVFDYLIVCVYRLSKGRPWALVFFLSILTAFLSAFLNSDIMALVMTPITIRLCETMALRTPFVLTVVAIYANLGGALTPLGTPTNAIVTNHPFVVAEGVDFVSFMVHMFPGVLIAMIVVFPLLYVTHRKKVFVLDQSELDLINQRAREKQPPTQSVLERIAQLKANQPSKHWLKPADSYHETLASLEDAYQIRDKPLLIKCCIALVFVYVCMGLHSIPGVAEGATLGWVTLLAAFLLIILDNKSDLNTTLDIIQWTILLFIAGLYVLTEALARLGIFKWLGDHAARALSEKDDFQQSAVTIVVLLWATACLCICIDNSVVSIFMLRLCSYVANIHDLPLPPMIWAITFGTCFGSNGSLFGAVSNEIIAWVALKAGYKIHFFGFFFIVFPIMLVTLVIATAYLLIAHPVLGWH